ncbi:MAG: hypothetical protein V9H69_24740 [Anaerolineae bacterium]
MPRELTWEQGWRWWEAELAAWEGEAAARLPLLRLEQQAALSAESRLALILVGLVEEDSRFGTVFARLQEPLPGRRPTVELLGQIVRGAADTSPDGRSLARALLDLGLVEAINPEAARAEWALRVPGEIWDAVRGDLPGRRGGWTYHPPEQFPPIDQLTLPGHVRRSGWREAPAVLLSGKARTLVVRGTAGSDRLRALGAIGRAMGVGVLAVDGAGLAEGTGRSLGPLCTMIGALPVITYDLAPGETVQPPELAAYDGPLGVILGAEGGLHGGARSGEAALTLRVPPLKVEQRLRCWQAALSEPSPDLAADRPALPSARRPHPPRGRDGRRPTRRWPAAAP